MVFLVTLTYNLTVLFSSAQQRYFVNTHSSKFLFLHANRPPLYTFLLNIAFPGQCVYPLKTLMNNLIIQASFAAVLIFETIETDIL